MFPCNREQKTGGSPSLWSIERSKKEQSNYERHLHPPVTDIRRKVFTEVARMAYNANELSDYAQLMRELPF